MWGIMQWIQILEEDGIKSLRSSDLLISAALADPHKSLVVHLKPSRAIICILQLEPLRQA